MQHLSIDIADSEKLARAVFHPYHLNKRGTKLRPSVYKAPADRRDVSVNRLIALNADACKVKALNVPNGDFRGFAVLEAKAVRDNNSDVIDTRENNYWGHADIMHPFTIKKGEPAPPEINQCLKNMVDKSKFHVDTSPKSNRWEGSPLDE